MADKKKKRMTLRFEYQMEYHAPMEQYQQQQYQENPEDNFEARDEDDIPLPPEIATRTRCYKLNLDANNEMILPHPPTTFLGPFTLSLVPPVLSSSSCASDESLVDHTTVAARFERDDYSSSEEESLDDCISSNVAIRTAHIFRGIVVAKDGKILAQNARARRSNHSGEESIMCQNSRQAIKIELAEDLVEETMATGKAPGSDEPAKMMSLVPMGEYDDMKHLILNGSKRLREASGHGDEVLFAANRTREKSSIVNPRTRLSLHAVSSTG